MASVWHCAAGMRVPQHCKQAIHLSSMHLISAYIDAAKPMAEHSRCMQRPQPLISSRCMCLQFQARSGPRVAPCVCLRPARRALAGATSGDASPAGENASMRHRMCHVAHPTAEMDLFGLPAYPFMRSMLSNVLLSKRRFDGVIGCRGWLPASAGGIRAMLHVPAHPPWGSRLTF